MEKLSIIIPMYNEEESLPHLYKRLVALADKIDNYKLEFLFVNDGSNDKSLKIVKGYREKDLRVCYLNLSRNFGKEVAMGAAFDYVTGDVVAIIDADLQDPPELIIDMLKYYEQGYDDVYAKRSSREGETWLKKFTSKSFYKVLDKVSNIQIQKDTGDFRLLSRRAVEALKAFPEKQRYTKGMFSLIGFKKKAIEFKRDSRVAGETKWNYFKLMDLAIEGITSFTIAPLRIATFVGGLFAVGSFGYMIFIAIRTLVYGIDVPGYASLICVMLLLGGIQLISLGVIGEYLGRVFIEVKDRPLYFIDEYSGNSDVDEK
ncbi:glycosyltransferase [Clostridium perfringens]|uniref:glycosyltransferase family 2 protein n=1 Tax=Clostridium perfringens TaxID=1502 RepID=UPI0018AC7C4E|nr:glycosyltransferase family 2 protein [Clostridium perfringens]EJT6665557.1 glycosyltransferase family 2 protein [Clostridium perfringens]MDB2069934.1 glycosyltransferase family 2 protein [Clostridium perfringens]MDK0651472.1 glycosyltransferase family 2 protein [Clostridium perfringens]MDK0668982.1 glycosyltransferase family 2 protein [Clostridium perfringens]MDU4500856.1 glycosyltransferase family 2 protein [Clostridium perfringens]